MDVSIGSGEIKAGSEHLRFSVGDYVPTNSKHAEWLIFPANDEVGRPTILCYSSCVSTTLVDHLPLLIFCVNLSSTLVRTP